MIDPVKEIDGRRLAREVATEAAAREVLSSQPSRVVSVLVNVAAFVAVAFGVWNQTSWPLLTRMLVAIAVLSSVALGLECYYLRRQVDALIHLARKGSGA